MNSDALIALDDRILASVRKIIRAADIHSYHLRVKYGLTTAQYICLRTVVDQQTLTLSQLRTRVDLSASTVTGIVDRLEAKGLLKRCRSARDRRVIFLEATPQGKQVVEKSPSLLQDRLANGLHKLDQAHQLQVAQSLESIVRLMEPEEQESHPGFEHLNDL